MRYIIDLVDDIREETTDIDGYMLHTMLLRDDPKNSEQLISVGEATIGGFSRENDLKKLTFTIDKEKILYLEDVIKHLLILPIEDMMCELHIAINLEYPSVEVIGFGKNTSEKKYFLFIKI